MVLEAVVVDCAGLAATPKLEPRTCNGLELLLVVAAVAMHGTLCFWHSAQMALSDGMRWHLLRRELYHHHVHVSEGQGRVVAEMEMIFH